MLRIAAIATLLLACNSHKPPSGQTADPTPSADRSARAPIVVRETGVGPIDGKTSATEAAMRSLFPGYDVTTAYPPGLDENSGYGPPDVHVSADGELHLIVLRNQAGNVADVRVTSSKVTSEAGWRVGDKLTDTSKLAICHCIGDGLICHASKSSHVGAVLDDDCRSNMEKAALAGKPAAAAYREIFAGEPVALAALKGRSIRMLRWTARAFDEPPGADDGEPPPPELE